LGFTQLAQLLFGWVSLNKHGIIFLIVLFLIVTLTTVHKYFSYF